MKRKGWLIPILFFFISISGLVVYQKSQNSFSYAGPTNLPPILWEETSLNINQIIYSEAGHEIKAVRANDYWMLEHPFITKADSSLIYSILMSFKQPVLTEVVAIDPVNLSEYGIDSFSPRIILYTKDDHIHELIRGNLADSSNYYVYSSMADTIYTMPKSAFGTLHTDPVIWRDKNLLSLDKRNIDYITLKIKETTYTVFPNQTASDPLFESADLDTKILNNLIDFLEVCKVDNFITDTADSNLFKAYGFDIPDLEITIILKTGEELIVALASAPKDENLFYASVNRSNSIVTIPYFDLSELIIKAPEPTDSLEPSNALSE